MKGGDMADIKYACATGCEDGIAIRGATAWWDQESQRWELSDDMEPEITCSECCGVMLKQGDRGHTATIGFTAVILGPASEEQVHP